MIDNQSVSDRLKKYRDSKGYKKSHFERMCGLSNGYLNSVSVPSADKLEKILSVCSDLNRAWVITGIGNMLNEEEKIGQDEDLLPISKARLMEIGAEVFKDKIIKMFEAGEIYPAHVIKEKDRLIYELTIKIGKLEEKLEQIESKNEINKK